MRQRSLILAAGRVRSKKKTGWCSVTIFLTDLGGTVTHHDGKFLAVDGFPFFDGIFLAVDGNSNLDGKSPPYRDRPPVRCFYVGKITGHSPEKNGATYSTAVPLQQR